MPHTCETCGQRPAEFDFAPSVRKFNPVYQTDWTYLYERVIPGTVYCLECVSEDASSLFMTHNLAEEFTYQAVYAHENGLGPEDGYK